MCQAHPPPPNSSSAPSASSSSSKSSNGLNASSMMADMTTTETPQRRSPFNSRVRRSRSWKDHSDGVNDANDVNDMAPPGPPGAPTHSSRPTTPSTPSFQTTQPTTVTPSPSSKRPTQNRRKRRPAKNSKYNSNTNNNNASIAHITPMHKCDEYSTDSTASLSDPSSDDGGCNSPQPKRNKNRSKGGGRHSPPKGSKNISSHPSHHPTKKAPNKHSRKCNSPPPSSSNYKSQKTPMAAVSIDEVTPQEKAKYIALDAEMVGIGPLNTKLHRSALARISLVNWEGEVLFDTHVKVNEPVTDYRTFVSGITARDLESERAMEFEECQRHVREMIRGKIVVGHGLKNDFRVLDLVHPWYDVRDTAKYEPFMKLGPDPHQLLQQNLHCYLQSNFVPMEIAEILVPKKLKVLAKDKLGIIIQEEGQCHDPIQDAVAAMELYKKHRVKWEKSVEWKVRKTKLITGE